MIRGPETDRPRTDRRALVTGAGGFVGVNLCAHLAAHGVEVHGTVRPPSGSGSPSRSTWRLPALREVATVHEVDLLGSRAAGAGDDLADLLVLGERRLEKRQRERSKCESASHVGGNRRFRTGRTPEVSE